MNTRRIKKPALLLTIMAFMAVASLPALAADTGKLIIKATGFKDDSGHALFAVVNSPEAYDDIGEKAMAKSRENIKAGKAESEFTLPYGWYAVSVVHDQNNNDKLDTNFLGIPKEPYGFSNNPKSMGKPSYDEAKFKLDAGQKVIEVTVE